MKKLLSMLLAVACFACLTPAARAAETSAADYSVAGKLLRQLWAGSGFSGTLELEIKPNEGRLGQAVTTQKPLRFGLDYIYVRPTGAQTAEHRADLSLLDGEAAQTSAHFQLKDGRLSFQADLIGADWYTFGDAAAGIEDGQGAMDGVRALGGELLAQSGMPSLLGFVVPMLLTVEDQGSDLTDLLNAYSTRVDLWMEEYRQNAELDKLEDGTTTMEARYAIAPAAIKAQLKQMVGELLADSEALARLRSLISEEDAELLLNPGLLRYYEIAIDALPLNGDLTILRTVSLKGDTLALHLSLPLYDSLGGDVTLRYDRAQGTDGLVNTLGIEGAARKTTLSFQEKSGGDGVTAWTGTLKSEPGEEAATAAGEGAEGLELGRKALSADFTLTREEAEGTDDEGRETYDYQLALAVAPDADTAGQSGYIGFPATDIALEAHFASKALKTASTEMSAALTVSGEERAQTISLRFEGKSRKKWEPEALPDNRVNVNAMTAEEMEAMLPGIATRSGLVLLQYFNLPLDGTQASPGPDAGQTPEAIATAAP